MIWGCVLQASNCAGINQEDLLPGASGTRDNLLEWFLERCLPTRHPSFTSATLSFKSWVTLKPKGLGDELNREVIRAQTKLPQNTCPLVERTRLFWAEPPTQWLLRSCWLPPYTTGFHSITVYGCAPPSNGTKHCDIHYSLENVQVLLRSSGKWLPLTLQTACSQQQALIVKKAIISTNSPDTIPCLWRVCPEHFWSTTMKRLSDEVRLENTGFSKVTFTCCRNSWAFEA